MHRLWGTQPMSIRMPDDDRPRRGRHLARPPANPHRPAGGHRHPLGLLPARLTALDGDHRRQAVDAIAALLADDQDIEHDHDDGGTQQ